MLTVQAHNLIIELHESSLGGCSVLYHCVCCWMNDLKLFNLFPDTARNPPLYTLCGAPIVLSRADIHVLTLLYIDTWIQRHKIIHCYFSCDNIYIAALLMNYSSTVWCWVRMTEGYRSQVCSYWGTFTQGKNQEKKEYHLWLKAHVDWYSYI